MRDNFVYLLFVVLFVIVVIRTYTVEGKGVQYVTYGSTLKLMNVEHKVRLHSNVVTYGSGSYQQIVTGIKANEDGNSYWRVKAGTEKQYNRGELIKCGDIIRLEHTTTHKNLHSHYVRSPISGKQEVSAFGDGKGEGDNGDNWRLICDNDLWKRDEPVILQHVDTNVYLAVSGRVYEHTITGQSEVVGDYTSDSPSAQWVTTEGVFIHPNDFKTQHHVHTEL